ncbi:MAG: beta-ketoacyl-ACP synthase III [Candidatus Eremiobacteraeota bacterium]|nr:beta-ketoacyl-ACP synthase III [Candidatus Eremiobacteraeota bacterium]
MTTVRSVGILGLGAYAPPKVLSNADLEKVVDTSDEWITTRTGIKERRIAESGTATSDLAVQAAEIAIKNSGVKPSEIQLVIAATASPDMLFPPTASIVQNRLHISNAGAFDLEAGCTGFLYAVSVASQFVACGNYERVLVVGAEVLSKFLDWEDRSTCILFGDGAGAAVVGPVPEGTGILSFHLGSDGSTGELLCMPAGGSQMPPSRKTVEEKLHYVKMKGNEVFRHAIVKMEESARIVLEKSGLTIDDISHYIPHQANIRIIEGVTKRLNVPEHKLYTNLSSYGNTSCASIPLALYEALQKGKIRRGDIVLLTSVGAGLTWGGMVIKWNY